jgi:hypothetical protein
MKDAPIEDRRQGNGNDEHKLPESIDKSASLYMFAFIEVLTDLPFPLVLSVYFEFRVPRVIFAAGSSILILALRFPCFTICWLVFVVK